LSPTIEELGIDKLSAEDRLALAQDIIDSVLSERRPALSQAKRDELRRRKAEHEANPGDVIPWEQLEAAALARSQP
jgi:putative addiction module component (TIGR02574 family)